MALQNNKN